MTISTLRWCAALMLIAGASQFAHAQVITDANTERGLRYPGTPNFDGEPYTQRYAYGTGGIFYLNGDARQLRYLDYRDRLDRAKKFGYAKPVDPNFDPHPLHRTDLPQDVLQDMPLEPLPPPAPDPVFSGILGRWRHR